MTATQAATCLHCGEPVDNPQRWTFQLDGQQHSFCCAGCHAVATAIVAGGLAHYYSARPPSTVDAVQPIAALDKRLSELSVFDGEQMRDRYLTADASQADGAATLNLSVQGMHCGACVWLLERTLMQQPGVLSATVSFATERAQLRFIPNKISVADILKAVARVGLQAAPYVGRGHQAAVTAQSRAFLQRLFVAGLAMMQLMMYALPAYLTTPGEIEIGFETLFRWVSLGLTTPVVFYSAWPFFQGAIGDLRRHRAGMDVPVALGIGAAYTYSVVATVTGGGQIYFDSVAMFVFFLLLARYLEWRVRRRAAGALDAISASTPDTAVRMAADGCSRETVPAASLAVGDQIEVTSGQTVPVDAQLVDTTTSIDESALTGESLPRRISAGQSVAAGAIVCGPGARMQVLRPVSDSAMAAIERLIAGGIADKPRAVALADQIAGYFVVAVLLLTALALFVWIPVDSARAGEVAITVLLISCPCALSLATPAALAAATGALLRSGVLITRGHVLTALAQVTDIVFDKTGTLTAGEPVLKRVRTFAGMTTADALAIASRLEAGSSHPFARAICRAGPAQRGSADGELTVRDDQAGAGVAGVMKWADGRKQTLRVGSAQWCGLSATGGARDARLRMPGIHSEVYLAAGPGGPSADETASCEPQRMEPLACFELADPIKDGADALIQRLRRAGHRIHLLSGDQPEVVADVARRLGIERYDGLVKPEEKRAVVRRLQHDARVVLMVGDGINDAPVLAQADVSVAVGRATDLARTAADAVVLSPDADGVVLLLDVARRTQRIIRQNIVWALTYNALALPLAFAGLVPAWAAALGMAGSSLLVTGNAARLWSAPESTPRGQNRARSANQISGGGRWKLSSS